jgi:hypothetical protein
MATRDAQEIERLRIEQGQQFLKQMQDMFQQTRVDLASQFVPRSEMEHVNDAVERVANAVEKLTGNVGSFHENAPRIFADRAETKQDLAELRTEIEKLKSVREADMQRGYGFRIEDMQGRYQGDMRTERGWRTNVQQQSTQTLGWIIGGGFVLFTTAVSIILALALR